MLAGDWLRPVMKRDRNILVHHWYYPDRYMRYLSLHQVQNVQIHLDSDTDWIHTLWIWSDLDSSQIIEFRIWLGPDSSYKNYLIFGWIWNLMHPTHMLLLWQDFSFASTQFTCLWFWWCFFGYVFSPASKNFCPRSISCIAGLGHSAW